MKTCLLLTIAIFCITTVLAQSSQPLLNVSRFEGNNGDQVATAVFSGFTNSKRVKMTDPETIERIKREGGGGTIIKAPAYLVTGRVNAVDFSNHSTASTDGKSTYYYDSQVSIELKMTNVITNETVTRMLSSSGSSTASHNNALQSAIQGISGQANGYARELFPASLSIIQILKESERKGITEFRAEGDGLTEKGTSGGGYISILTDTFGPPKTRISIKHRYELTRPDGTSRWISEEVGEAKIIKLEGSDQSEGQTAICSVTKGGEKLRELWNKKATLVLVTTN